MPDEYVTVRLPLSLRERFERLNKRHFLGYASFAEIVKESLRKRLEEIEATYSRPKSE